jgi:hypothetical protein
VGAAAGGSGLGLEHRRDRRHSFGVSPAGDARRHDFV